LASTAAVDCEPLVALPPAQAPEAVQAVVFVDFQVKVAMPPLLTVLGVAPRATVGAAASTVTVVSCDVFPWIPVHVNIKVELTLTAPVLWVPLTLLVPDQAPEATQEVASSLVQVSDDASPRWTVLGLAWSVTWGAEELTVTVISCDAEPSGPVHLISNSVLLDRRPVDHVPLVAMAPCQPPSARHSVALVTLHLRVDVPRLSTVVGEAAKVIEGAERWVTVT
jgi:hypothetical protein